MKRAAYFFQLSTSFKHFQILQLFRWNDFESTSDLLHCTYKICHPLCTQLRHNCITMNDLRSEMLL